MKILWTLIDGIITAPAWILGYFVTAYTSAYQYGGQCYVSNVKKYWTGSASNKR